MLSSKFNNRKSNKKPDPDCKGPFCIALSLPSDLFGDQQWVQCSKCNKWYHQECQLIVIETAKNALVTNEAWECSICTKVANTKPQLIKYAQNELSKLQDEIDKAEEPLIVKEAELDSIQEAAVQKSTPRVKKLYEALITLNVDLKVYQCGGKFVGKKAATKRRP